MQIIQSSTRARKCGPCRPVEGVLTADQRAAGLQLVEPDDHLVMLVRSGCILGVFSQSTTAEDLRAEADKWLPRRGSCPSCGWPAPYHDGDRCTLEVSGGALDE